MDIEETLRKLRNGEVSFSSGPVINTPWTEEEKAELKQAIQKLVALEDQVGVPKQESSMSSQSELMTLEKLRAFKVALDGAKPKDQICAFNILDIMKLINENEHFQSELARVTAERDALKVPEDFHLVPFNPPESQWSGLARDIMMWLDLADRKTPRTLLRHLELCGTEISVWLRNEPEMQYLDHVISKGTRVVILYKAMLAAAPKLEV